MIEKLALRMVKVQGISPPEIKLVVMHNFYSIGLQAIPVHIPLIYRMAKQQLKLRMSHYDITLRQKSTMQEWVNMSNRERFIKALCADIELESGTSKRSKRKHKHIAKSVESRLQIQKKERLSQAISLPRTVGRTANRCVSGHFPSNRKSVQMKLTYHDLENSFDQNTSRNKLSYKRAYINNQQSAFAAAFQGASSL